MNRSLIACWVVLGWFLTAGLPAADWPQYRYDAQRSAASPERLPDELHLAWRRELPAPRPAFPAEVRLRFDESYEPVVEGKTLFLPSMVTDTVTALDTDSGAERWRFFAEGPVRFAPAVWRGNVYFVSDDGCLYCVSAADGSLRWRYRHPAAEKADRKLLGHGRLISLRPARGGPVVKDGVVYFGAGIWSTYGVAVAAVDALTGKNVWANTDSDHIARANMDHCVANEAGLSPQGYLALIHETLVVPCGAQLPAFLDPKTGVASDYTMGWGGRNGLPKGTWFVAGGRNYLSHGGDLYDLSRPNDERFLEGRWKPEAKTMLYPGGRTRLDIDPTNHKDLGAFRQPVFDGDVMYSGDGDIVASSLLDVRLVERSKSPVPPLRRNDTYPDKWQGHFAEIWRMKTELKLHIKAGDQLYLGGQGIVAAARTVGTGEEPRIAWQTTLDGTPHSMIAADGKLFVVTDEGSLYAFGDKKGEPKVYALSKAPLPTDAAATREADEILKAARVREGYALVLGITDGRLVEQLLARSDLNLIVIDEDAQQVAALRERLHRAGLYGIRASAHVGDPFSYPLPPYMAHLIVSEDWAQADSSGQAIVETVFHPLRPYGGTACLAIAAAERERLLKEFADSGPAEPSVRQAGELLLVSREGPLPGSAPWSHGDANAANTGASEDRFLTAPMELLWFDGPARWIRTPGATLVRVAGGRMFLKAQNLIAVDVFTGRRLWEVALPFPHTVIDQMIAIDDAIYITGDRTCFVIDPATGREMKRIELPAEMDQPWSNLRVEREFLIGQSGPHLLCLNRASSQIVWQYECGCPSLSVAVGNGRVFCAELANKRRGNTQTFTRAFKLETGNLVWQQPGGSILRYSREGDLLVRWSDVLRGTDGSVLAELPDPTPAPDETPASVPRPLFVVGEKLLLGTAETLAVYDLPDGKATGQTLTWTRRGCTIPRASSNMVTTRVLGNAACIDLATGDTVHFWNVRAACSNNLFPADGLLNMPSLTGGCTCNYLPVSQAFVPTQVIARAP
mgnify:FL=1